MNWHGHQDRGLGVANNIAAVESGADVIHGTALGVGERAGNATRPNSREFVALWVQSIKTLPCWMNTCRKQMSTSSTFAKEYPVFGEDGTKQVPEYSHQLSLKL